MKTEPCGETAGPNTRCLRCIRACRCHSCLESQPRGDNAHYPSTRPAGGTGGAWASTQTVHILTASSYTWGTSHLWGWGGGLRPVTPCARPVCSEQVSAPTQAFHIPPSPPSPVLAVFSPGNYICQATSCRSHPRFCSHVKGVQHAEDCHDDMITAETVARQCIGMPKPLNKHHRECLQGSPERPVLRGTATPRQGQVGLF